MLNDKVFWRFYERLLTSTPVSNVKHHKRSTYRLCKPYSSIRKVSKQNHNPTRETLIMHLKTLILNLLPRPINRSWGPFDHY
jgi:hypothetical protein